MTFCFSNLLAFFVIDWFVIFGRVQQSEINAGEINWAGTKKIIQLELSLYHLKWTIYYIKSYDVQGKIISVALYLKTSIFLKICLFLHQNIC